MKNFIIRNKIIFVVLFWILVWQVIYLLVNSEIIIPSPISVVKKLGQLIVQKDFIMSILSSSIKTLGGFLGALILGSLLAVLSYYFKWVKVFLNPLFVVIKTTPIASFILIALLLISSAFIPLFIALIMVLPIVWENIYTGINSVDSKYIEMAKVYNYTKMQSLKYIYIPKVRPYFASAAIVGIGFAWKSAITAELLSSIKYSIGNQIYNAKIYLETDTLFAWTIVIIILSIIFTKVFTKFMEKLK